MPVDDLNDPLGAEPVPPASARATATVKILALVLVAGATSLLGWRIATHVPQPLIAEIQHPKPPAPVVVAAAPALPPGTDATGSIAGPRQSGQQVEARSGVRVVRQGDNAPPGALIIKVPQRLGVQLTPAPDRRLIEKSPEGLLPKIAADGSRASDIYARPLIIDEKLPAGAPRVAILVGGLGLNSAITQTAVHELPGEISLGFAPYGANLQQQVNQARNEGHEVLLQAPMEPFDYPRNNPGVHTLLTTNSAAHTLVDLHWLMSRFTGYIGIENFLGAKFTADASALRAVLGEVESRGLMYVDDGTSPQSQARDLANSSNMSFSRADVVIDADQDPAAIAAALQQLETVARLKGSAIGTASALPESIRKINIFAKSLKRDGIALVPLSALAVRGPKLDADNR